MSNKFLLGTIAILVVSGVSVFALLNNISGENIYPDNTPTDDEQVFCTMDAKLCPDGSYVGRTGKDCHFAECPATNLEKTTVSTSIGKVVNYSTLSITPKEVISDSRCPVDVQCIWEGTVEVKTELSTKDSNTIKNLKLNTPEVFGDYTITLVEVSPAPKEGVKVPSASYRFTFQVSRMK